jgi:hypothetical protein
MRRRASPPQSEHVQFYEASASETEHHITEAMSHIRDARSTDDEPGSALRPRGTAGEPPEVSPK